VQVGSLKAARTKGVIKFQGQLLLMPVHKDVELHLIQPLPEGLLARFVVLLNVRVQALLLARPSQFNAFD
jgi:hypothetical protein